MGKLVAHGRRNLVAYLALFIALGGTSIAAGDAVLPKNSVGTRHMDEQAGPDPAGREQQ